MDYATVQLPVYASTGVQSKEDKSESRYWKSFTSNIFIKSYASVTALHFSQSTPHRFAVTSGTQVQVYTQKSAKVVKTISRFKETARSACIRDDGKLIVAGDDSGLVQVFDLASRAILRSIKEHSQPVRTTLFSPSSSGSNTPQILTTSDDSTVRTFDLSTAAPLSLFEEHEDYVRTGSFVPSNPSLYLSGSYDGTVKLWDARAPSTSALTLVHGYPVESVLVHPSGTLAISAGGPLIRVWDLLSGSKRSLKALSNHQKTVTCLCWGDQEQKKVLSGGLDGLVKVYQVEDGQWKVGHTMRYGGQILSMALSPNDSTLVVGSADGTLTVRSKPTLTPPSAANKQARQAKRAAIKADAPPAPPEIKYSSKAARSARPPKQNEWDRLLRVFRYSDALDAVMDRSKDPRYIVAVLDELKRLDGLKQALQGRNDRDLLKVLKFVNQQIADPRWGAQVSEYVGVLIQLYERVLGQSPAIDKLFQQLKRRIEEEVEFHDDLYKVQGALEMIFSVSLHDEQRPSNLPALELAPQQAQVAVAS